MTMRIEEAKLEKIKVAELKFDQAGSFEQYMANQSEVMAAMMMICVMAYQTKNSELIQCVLNSAIESNLGISVRAAEHFKEILSAYGIEARILTQDDPACEFGKTQHIQVSGIENFRTMMDQLKRGEAQA